MNIPKYVAAYTIIDATLEIWKSMYILLATHREKLSKNIN